MEDSCKIYSDLIIAIFYSFVPSFNSRVCRTVSFPSYVAEMMTNRVLRFFQQPSGVYHASVFYQLSGGVGPSSLAIDSQGNLYIGHYDTRGKRCYAGGRVGRTMQCY